jgi:Xaa-Pro aminopeptidase
MEKRDIDGVIATTRDNIEYISGFTTMALRYEFKQFALIIPFEGEPALVLDTVHIGNAKNTSWIENLKIWGIDGRNYVDCIKEICNELGIHNRRIGMELNWRLNMTQNQFDYLKKDLAKAEIVDATDIFEDIRVVKSDEEVRRIKKACDITVMSWKEAFDSLKAGKTERDLLNDITISMLEKGADNNYNYYAGKGALHLRSGEKRKTQMGPAISDRVIKSGDIIRIDGGASYKGYVCDMCRTFIFDGMPNNEQQKLFDTLVEAHKIIPDTIKPGFTTTDIYRSIMRVVKEAGHDKHVVRWGHANLPFSHLIGHNIGFHIHERPDIYDGEMTVWKPGMVMAVELLLGEYEEENDYLITEEGCELLTPLEHKSGYLEGETWKIL